MKLYTGKRVAFITSDCSTDQTNVVIRRGGRGGVGVGWDI